MKPDEIKKILETVKYPGYSRDIVSFGMVKEIEIDDSSIKIILSGQSKNSDVEEKIKFEIINKLKTVSQVPIEVNFITSSTPSSQGKQKPSAIKNIIAIASCKGGVGKSTCAVNIAALAAKKYKVGLLDLDIYGPSLPTLLGLNTQPEFTADKKIKPLRKFNMDLMSFGFLNSENAPAIWRGPMVSRMTQQFFDDVLWNDLDFLFLDLPPGTGDIQLTLVQKLALSGAIIITTPQELALIDVKKGSDMFMKVNTPILGVIENMSKYVVNGNIVFNDNKIFENMKIKLETNNQEISVNKDGSFEMNLGFLSGNSGLAESERLQVPYLGSINFNPLLSESSDEGIPFVLKYPQENITLKYESILEEVFRKIL